jgi:hypothetical protein
MDMNKALEGTISEGGALDLLSGDPGTNDPARIDIWPQKRTIQAEHINSLLAEKAAKGEAARLSIRGARILGPLNLNGLDSPISLELYRCYLPDTVSLEDARLKRLSLEGSLLEGALSARGLEIGTDVRLTRGFMALNDVDLTRAEIHGDLICGGGRFMNTQGHALRANSIKVGCNVFLNSGFTAEGETTIIGGQIGGQLVCDRGRFWNSEGRALAMDGITVDKGIHCRHNFESRGEVRLPGASVSGPFDLSGAIMKNPEGVALRLDHATVDGNVLLREAKIQGLAGFLGSNINGRFEASRMRISNSNSIAVEATGISVQDSLTFVDAQVEGALYLARGVIGGNLQLDGADLMNSRRTAILADSATVKGRVVCRRGFAAAGSVNLRSASVGSLDFEGATLRSESLPALVAAHASVQADVFIDRGFRASGEVDFSRSNIRGDLLASEAEFTNPTGNALNFGGITATTLHIGEGSKIRGTVEAYDGRIRSSVIFKGCEVLAPGKAAVKLDGCHVGGNLVFEQGFVARGEVRFLEAEVARQIRFGNCELRNPQGKALAGDGASAKVLFMHSFRSEGTIRFVGTKIARQCSIEGEMIGLLGERFALQMESSEIDGGLHLLPSKPMRGGLSLANTHVGYLRDNQNCWKSSYDLRSFRYGALAEPKWKQRSTNGALTTRQRIDWIRGTVSGYEPEAYDTLAAAYARAGLPHRQRHVLIAKNRKRRARLGRPARLFSYLDDWLIGFGYRPWRVIVPFLFLVLFGFIFFRGHEAEMIKVDPAMKHLDFEPFAYTLDLLVPVVDLGQRRNWEPGHDFVLIKDVIVVSGWVLSAAILAALTSSLRRSD